MTKCIKDQEGCKELSFDEFKKKDFPIILVECGGYKGLLHQIRPQDRDNMDTCHIISLENKCNFMQDNTGHTSFLYFDIAIERLLAQGYDIYGFDYLDEFINFLKGGD